MTHFDDVLRRAYEVLTADPGTANVDRVTVLRDMRGRVRLFPQPAADQAVAVAKLCERVAPRLSEELGCFWGGLIEADDERSDMAALLRSVEDEREPLDALGFGGWSIVERHAAKAAWLGRSAEPPWPFHEGAPPVVSFFSHKGGVGRTTALCATAVNFARAGYPVAVVDLDVEAPSLGALLESGAELGAVDYLLERVLGAVQPDVEFQRFVVPQRDPVLIGPEGAPIYCVPAGLLAASYLEKLARLDYELLGDLGTLNRNPLADLLRQLRSAYEPALILLDCRSGLHDLGGLAVHGLSHLEVLFGLDSEPSWQGIRLLLGSLSRVGDALPNCAVVHALEPEAPGEVRDRARERFLEASYDAFLELYYADTETESVPDIGNEDAPHFPFRIPYLRAMAGYQRLADVAEVLTGDPLRQFAAWVGGRAGKPL